MTRAIRLPARFTVPADREADRYRYGLAHPWLSAALVAGWKSTTEPEGLAPWVSMERGGSWVDLVFPSWDDSNPFGAAQSAGELLAALELYSQSLRIRFRFSAGRTGLQLMRAVHSGSTGTRLPEADVPDPAERGIDSHAVALHLGEIPAAGYLHVFDVNGMYLAACSSAELGFGKPTHHRQAGAVTAAAGYWRARIRPAGAVPFPFTADDKPHWYTAPALELAREAGLRVHVGEAWVYPEHHRWFDPWYARLRDARSRLGGSAEPGARLALDAVKATYTRPLGHLAGRWKLRGDPTFRPDWRDAVVTRARANMYRHLERVRAYSGAVPVLLDADAAGYVCVEADPARAAELLGLEVSPQLGKWKHAGTVEAARAHQIARDARGRATAVRRILAAVEAP